MNQYIKLNGFEELLHENGIDPEDAFDDRGMCVVTRQGSRAGEYPSFEYSLGGMQMTREQIIKALSGSIDSMITNKSTMIHISGPMAENVLRLLKEQEDGELKTGHWIYDSTDYEAWTHTCSECEKRMVTAFGMYANFCWNCGAKMDGQAVR